MQLKDITGSDVGAILISILLGLGLAALFRKACSDGRCVVVQGPDPREVSKNVYKVAEDCYTYTPYVAPCTDDAVKS